MKRNRGAVGAQRKIINNADKFNNAGIKKQQGTTRVIYDSLLLDGSTEFRFFEGSNNRNFPLTNMGADGNKLSVGGAMAIERAYFSIFTYNGTNVTSIVPLDTLFPDLMIGELGIELANRLVLKQVPALSFTPDFNKNATFDSYNNFEFDTQLVIQPLLQFAFPFKTNTNVAVLNTYLRLTVEGVGAIIAPKDTF